ncbi:hypothetical protein [Legionella sp. CNM-4043-24]|uniref:hypothetical protein n=1 Tax=Legionella sp. CNM-4043-24 TaxID=3421646 RepID=UPI00403AC1B6
MKNVTRLFCALLLVFALPVFAGDDASIDVPQQQDDQEICQQQFVTQCVAKCDATVDSDCQSECQEQAKNQCRQAGE